MTDKQRYDSQRRPTPPLVPPITPQIQALLELQPLNQSSRQTASQLTQMQDYITEMQTRNYQPSPESQIEHQQQQMMQMQNYITQMQAHNYQQSPELAPSGPAEGSPELQPEQGEAQDVRADYQVNLRYQKITPEIVRELMTLYDPEI
ncbi:MAG: hypothetical protein EZS28_016859 [Streblomastix strix]|uniref:Uncharacterized protein n=1 Tax=Streblomastix strix TaxID=222440 RepID=A0A5J4VZB6_9EUKA|nr:MAG: hypothetical protein EZS28_016859 [Streblomastix strix]